MRLRSIASTAITLLLAGFIIFVILSQVFGFPAPIAFVETGSMAGTIDPGEGFIGIPAPLAGEPSVGDVVTYRAQSIQGGGLTTHRIVDITEAGYETQGDANSVTDQANGEPYVTDPQIELVVLQLNGEVVTIPGVGTAARAGSGVLSTIATAIGVSGTPGANTGLALGVAGLLIVGAAYAYDLFTGSATRELRRSTRRWSVVDSRLILLALLIALSLPILSVMAVPSGTTEITIISAEFESPDDPTIIEAGETSESTSRVEAGPIIPRTIVLEPRTDGVQFADRVLQVSPGGTAETTLILSAPTETGSYIRARSEHHYIGILPSSVIVALHDIHPFVAMTTITGLLLSPIAVLFYLIVGFRPIVLREETR